MVNNIRIRYGHQMHIDSMIRNCLLNGIEMVSLSFQRSNCGYLLVFIHSQRSENNFGSIVKCLESIEFMMIVVNMSLLSHPVHPFGCANKMASTHQFIAFITSSWHMIILAKYQKQINEFCRTINSHTVQCAIAFRCIVVDFQTTLRVFTLFTIAKCYDSRLSNNKTFIYCWKDIQMVSN